MKRLQVHKQTRLCRFFVVGACTRGEACAFAHGKEKLKQQPDFSKTRLCADFVELGSCMEGDRCKFAHGRCELRPGSAPKIGRPSKKETKDIPRKQQEDKDSASIKAAQIIQLRHSLHSQAALKLLMDSASRAPSKKAQEQPDLEDVSTSFSRQTTWEGIDTASAAFSRGTSSSSQSWEPMCQKLPELGSEWQVQVKNTFIEASDSDESDIEDQGVLRRTHSVPLF
ncbi:unnamed protein product [Durusdinium trenchii]|uniref:C3H1-type domain-containing protein n=1 Tax=Durusdinium trenchii TaxID=1381693 RepID=A0ABP0LBN9_9DINO